MVKYSTKTTMDRNSSIFWAFFQSSLVIGPLYVFISWHGKTEITDKDRILLYSVLTALSAIAVLIFCLLKVPPSTQQDQVGDVEMTSAKSCSALKEALELATTKNMISIMILSGYTGSVASMYNIVLPTAVGSTGALSDAKSLVGLVGMLVGTGEIFGSFLSGLFIKIFGQKSRGIIIIFALIFHFISFFLIFISIPTDAVLQQVQISHKPTLIQPTTALVATISLLLGLGDAAFNTHAISITGILFPTKSASAFALFLFTKSLMAATGYLYGSVLLLNYQIIILIIFCFFGTISFLFVENGINY